jgi:hypothetical protein
LEGLFSLDLVVMTDDETPVVGDVWRCNSNSGASVTVGDDLCCCKTNFGVFGVSIADACILLINPSPLVGGCTRSWGKGVEELSREGMLTLVSLAGGMSGGGKG